MAEGEPTLKKKLYEVPGQFTHHDGLILQTPLNRPDIVDRVKTFTMDSSDILVAGYPKAGTTWMLETADLVMHGGDTYSRASPVYRRTHQVEHFYPPAGAPVLDLLASVSPPRVLMSHLPAAYFRRQVLASKVKVIVTMRNPKDVLVSYYYFYKMNKLLGPFRGTWDEFFDIFKAKGLLYGDPLDWYKTWWELKDNSNVLVVKYEDAITNSAAVIRQVATLYGTPLSDDVISVIQHETCFDSMKANPMTNLDNTRAFDTKVAHFLRKGTIGDWQNYFSAEQSQFVDNRCEAELQPIGLTFQYKMINRVVSSY